VPSGSLQIGIYAGGLGAEVLKAALADVPGGRAVLFYHLRPAFLAPFSVILLPQLADLAELDDTAIQHLRAWTAAGGRLILTHDAVGTRWHPRLFPEVGTGRALRLGQAMQLAAAIGPLRAGTTFTAGYGDYIPIDPASGARVLVRAGDEGSPPVVVAGTWKRGEVILNGMLPGHGPEPLSGVERELLRALALRGAR
jgi:hypothetical protein